tara:strand:+ start:4531 stop:5937 length:1407 start_codon:yes stop_codon:yes gene_type:complete
MIKVEKIFYDNKWISSLSNKVYSKKSLINKNVFHYADCSSKDLNKVILSAKLGLEINKNLKISERQKILKKITDLIRSNLNYLAKLEMQETGKNFKDALSEIKHSISLWNYASNLKFRDNYKKNLNKNHFSFTKYEPVGIVSLIIPWNFPFIVLSERLPFILAAGNSVIIKPSEFASQSIIYLIKLIKKAGQKKGVLNFITGKGEKIGKNLTEHKEINMISFTGSTSTGKKIMKSSSNNIKRLNLELGGKNPILIFSDANISKTVDIIIKSFTLNSGQCCVATSRLFVEKKIKKKLTRELIKSLSKTKSFKQSYGLISNEKQLSKIKQILKRNKRYEKKIIFGNTNNLKDNFMHPIIYENLPLDSDLLKTEIFGPILTINTFVSFSEAINLANNTDYGLSAVICGEDKKRNLLAMDKIKAGRIWINQSIDKNFPQLPIGGYKESGLNRECGPDAIKTYSEIKSVIIKK